MVCKSRANTFKANQEPVSTSIQKEEGGWFNLNSPISLQLSHEKQTFVHQMSLHMKFSLTVKWRIYLFTLHNIVLFSSNIKRCWICARRDLKTYGCKVQYAEIITHYFGILYKVVPEVVNRQTETAQER